MADYSKAASELKARMDAKLKRRLDLNDFFEGLRTGLSKEVEKANVELIREGISKIEIQRASVGEPTIDLMCGKATCNISQNRSAPSIGAVITGEAGEKTITFLILLDESPLKARRLSVTAGVGEKVDTVGLASTFVEELIAAAP
jgi:hypothetical protein